MDKMMTYHSIDVQWGTFVCSGQMGAAADRWLYCKRNPYLREIWKPGYFGDGYGINLLHPAAFAITARYGDDPSCFQLKGSDSAVRLSAR